MKGCGATPQGLNHLAGLHKNSQYFPDQSLIYEIFRKKKRLLYEISKKEKDFTSPCSFRRLSHTTQLRGTVQNTLGVMVLRRQDAIVTFQNGADWNMRTAHEITEHPRNSIQESLRRRNKLIELKSGYKCMHVSSLQKGLVKLLYIPTIGIKIQAGA